MDLPMAMPATIEISENEKQLRAFYKKLRAFSVAPPNLILKFHQASKSIECMIAENLQDGLDIENLSSNPEKRAYEFLIGLADHFGINAIFLRKYLFLKHVLRSSMGSHCIFGLRQRTIELEENGFFVHLDRANNIVMMAATYQTPYDLNDNPETWPDDVVSRGLEDLRNKIQQQMPIDKIDKEVRFQRVCYDGWVWVLNWQVEPPTYVLRYKVKVTTTEFSYVALINRVGICDVYSIDAHDQPNALQLGHIFGSSWSVRVPVATNAEQGRGADNQATEEIPRQPPLRRILLRGVLEDNGQLAGRYVAVEDRLSPIWPTVTEPGATDSSSHLDRVMAFYHIHKMQEYFRRLGLFALDDYRHLNPLHVVLTPEYHTAYVSTEQRIYFRTLREQPIVPWTQARNSRTVYHECVHAVTDALARLRRQDLNSAQNKQTPQLLQAAAIDEGLADYFACSMVAQEGDPAAEYRSLHQKEDGTVCWSDERRSLVTGKLNLNIVNSTEQSARVPSIVYEWCQHWARYLWLLRQQLGAEVADVLIANSIFFLNRWSSFGMGVLALVTADRLLFQGSNRDIILNTSKVHSDDVAEFYTEESGDLIERIREAVPSQPGLRVRHIQQDDETVPLLPSDDMSPGEDSLVMIDFSPSLGEESPDIDAEQSAVTFATLDIGDIWQMEDGTEVWLKQSL